MNLMLLALFDLWASLDLWKINIPAPVALAVICVVGYLFGRRSKVVLETDAGSARREIKRARSVANRLEKIAEALRRDLAAHHGSVAKFKTRVASIGDDQNDITFQDLCREAEDVLGPTMRLATQISHAYDEIRQQTTFLMNFTEVRTDQLTGVYNRRGLDESLETLFAMNWRYEIDFSLLLIDIDHFKKVNDTQGHLAGDELLKEVSSLINECARETDIVTRYGGEEFVVLLPSTPLEGATLIAERLRTVIAEKLKITVSGGVTSAEKGDTSETILSRADAALYSAKTDGRNRIFSHDGQNMQLQTIDSEVEIAISQRPQARLEKQSSS